MSRRWIDEPILQFFIFSIVVLVLTGQSPFAEDHFRVESLPKMVKQGEVFSIRAFGPASMKSVYVQFQGIRFPMAFDEQKGAYEGLVGIDVNTRPAIHPIRIVGTEEAGGIYVSPLSIKVKKVDFGVQRLSLPSSMVDLDAKTQERVSQEASQLTALFQAFREERLWKNPFIRPVKGELSGRFGVRRILNSKPRGQHTGVDLRAEEGTPVLACNNGVVALVAQLFFSGKSVILDHGGGLYSMYFHLSETMVNEGDRVNKGAMLGRVGSTGRSTKPHLHWGIRINGARVDPLSLPGVIKTAESPIKSSAR